MAAGTVKPATAGLDREVVLYGLVKVRSTARSATIEGAGLGVKSADELSPSPSEIG